MTTPDIGAVILYGGAGGATKGIHDAGIRNTVSVEYWGPAVETACAAGFDVIQGDVTALYPLAMAHKIGNPYNLLLQASPPCQGMSLAGKGKGREDIERLFTSLDALAEFDIDEAAQYAELFRRGLEETCSDEKSPLTFEVMRWVTSLQPEFVMLEQVPTVLPVWQKIGEVLTRWGYSVWTGNVQAEQYGVPQTRKRAMLLASLQGEVSAPAPTHSKYHTRSPKRLDEGVLPWVSMATAMGWRTWEPTMVSNYGTGGDASKRGTREASEPAPTVTSKIGRNKWETPDALHMNDRPNGARRDVDTPAPTMMFGHDAASCKWHYREPVPAIDGETVDDLDWTLGRPSPTIVGSYHPEVVAKPKYRKAGDGPRQKQPGSVRVTVQEAGILQSFPWDYPWQSTTSNQYLQIGNAVPPLLQQRLTEHLVGCQTVAQIERNAA